MKLRQVWLAGLEKCADYCGITRRRRADL